MKTQLINILKSFISITIVILFFSCEKSDDLNNNDVTGTYIGTLSSILTNKSNSELIKPATVIVSSLGNQIQIYCQAENFDTIVMLDIYDHNDNVMVCLTGEEFENMYGHMLGQGNMNGNMHNGTDWMNHLNNEHQDGDEHFGDFDMQHHAFNYTFRMNNGDFYFEGIKE